MNFLIPDKEPQMTETEILKAAECCKSENCFVCPLSSNRFESECKDIFLGAVVDLINRKNAEIDGANELVSVAIDVQNNFHEKIEEQEAANERLNKEVDRLSQVVLYHEGQIAEAKAEVIKEFAEKVKVSSNKTDLICSGALVRREYTITEESLDQIAKEMGVEL